MHRCWQLQLFIGLLSQMCFLIIACSMIFLVASQAPTSAPSSRPSLSSAPTAEHSFGPSLSSSPSSEPSAGPSTSQAPTPAPSSRPARSRTREPQRRPRHRPCVRQRCLTFLLSFPPTLSSCGDNFGLSFTRKFRFWGRWGLAKAQAPLVIN